MNIANYVKKLNRAVKIIEGLRGEEQRWLSEIQLLLKNKEIIISHAVISASMLIYSGQFTQQYRQQIVIFYNLI